MKIIIQLIALAESLTLRGHICKQEFSCVFNNVELFLTQHSLAHEEIREVLRIMSTIINKGEAFLILYYYYYNLY